MNQIFKGVKREVRVLGVDDGSFVPKTTGKAIVVGVVLRGNCWIEGVMSTQISVDGTDATDRISSMITGSRHFGQLRVIMLSGITFAGFNVVNTKLLNVKTGLSVIAVVQKKPNIEKIHEALKNLPLGKERWQTIREAGDMLEVPTKKGSKKIYVQTAGISITDAQRILRLTTSHSVIPEPLRIAHLIASGLSPQ